MVAAHQEEMATTKQELESSHELAMQEVRDQLMEEKESEVRTLTEKITAEMEQLHVENDKRVNDALRKGSESASEANGEKLASVTEEYEKKLAETQFSHETELERVSSEVDSLNSRLQESKAQHESNVQSISEQFQEAMEKIRVEAAEDETSSLNECKNQFKERINNIKDEFESRAKTAAEESEAKQKEYVAGLRKSHSEEIERIKTEHGTVLEEERSKRD